MSRSLTDLSQNHYALMLPEESRARRRLEEIYGRTPLELTSLYEELAVCKLAAEDGVALFAQADMLVDVQQRARAKATAYEMLNKVFGQIGRLAESAARIDQYNRTSTSLQMARVIIDEAGTIARNMFVQYVPASALDHFQRALANAFDIQDGPLESGGTRQSVEADMMATAMDNLTTGRALEDHSFEESPTQKNGQTNGKSRKEQPWHGPDVDELG